MRSLELMFLYRVTASTASDSCHLQHDIAHVDRYSWTFYKKAFSLYSSVTSFTAWGSDWSLKLVQCGTCECCIGIQPVSFRLYCVMFCNFFLL